MKRIRAAIVLSFVLVVPVCAQSNGVGLGISAGSAFPQGSTRNILSTDWLPSFNWGFYVNIPLIYTFHLTPSSELYKFNNLNATDFDIAFKFIVPLSRFTAYAGFTPGLTAVGDVLAGHIGVLGGASLRLISNLDFFAQAKYTWVFEESRNLGVLHLNAGVLFNF